jgi:hypothetical protein
VFFDHLHLGAPRLERHWTHSVVESAKLAQSIHEQIARIGIERIDRTAELAGAIRRG